MKSAALILLACGLVPLSAQETRVPVVKDQIRAFAITPPDENSPFFLDPQAAARTRATEYAGRDVNDTIAEYPKTRSADSVPAQVKKFFSGMFSSVNIGPLRTPPTTESLAIDPAKFSLGDRREITATYVIRNNTKKMTRIEYPTSQRVDIVTTDSKGAVVDRWSDDRSFQPEDGIVVINPKERIEYQETIPTREMKAGETYKIEAFTTGTEKFPATKSVTPQ
jgi:hypothetical protein